MGRNNKLLVTLMILSSFFISTAIFLLLISLYSNLNKEEKKKYNESELKDYFTKKYNYSFNVANITNLDNNTIKEDYKFCESLNSKKDKALCKSYIKLKKLNYEGYKQYLPLALVYFEHKDPYCYINKGFSKLKMAEFLENISICGDNLTCINKVKNFIKYYQNKEIVKNNVEFAYKLYKKGILKDDYLC